MEIERIMKDMIYLIGIVICVIWISIYSVSIGVEELKWIFSAAAQSISALIAFLLAGYALFLGELDKESAREASRREINHSIRIKSFKQFKMILICSFLTVIINIASISILKIKDKIIAQIIFSLSFCLIIFSLFFIYIFIIQLINPNRTKIVARIMLKEDRLQHKSEEGDIKEFINLFKQLEIKLQNFREGWERLPPAVIAYKILKENLIENDLFAKIREIIKIRNLLFHSNLDNVTTYQINLLKDILHKLKSLNL